MKIATIFLASLESLCTDGGFTKLRASSTIHSQMFSSPGSLAQDSQLISGACLFDIVQGHRFCFCPTCPSTVPSHIAKGLDTNIVIGQAALPQIHIQKPATFQHYLPGFPCVSAWSQFHFCAYFSSLLIQQSLKTVFRESHKHVSDQLVLCPKAFQ